MATAERHPNVLGTWLPRERESTLDNMKITNIPFSSEKGERSRQNPNFPQTARGWSLMLQGYDKDVIRYMLK